MPFQQLEPRDELKPFIKCFWTVSRTFSAHDPAFEVLPDAYREIIFSLKVPCQLVSDKYTSELPGSFAVNLLEKPLYFRADGEMKIIGVRLYPWVTFGRLNSREAVLPLPLAFNGWREKLLSLFHPAQDASVFQALQELFISAPSLFDSDDRLREIGRSILDSRGTGHPAEAAQAAFTSLRNVERIFKTGLGQTPKSLSRKVRFEFMRNLLWEHPDTNLTELAYEMGFADLSHLSNEFKYFSQKSPTAFIAEVNDKKGKPSR